MKQGRSLMELGRELQRQRLNRQDFLADTRSLEVESNSYGSTLHLSLDGKTYGFGIGELAHQQIASRLNIPFRYYVKMQSEAPDLLDQNINRWLNEKPERRMVRVLDGKVRAFLSDRYRRLDNLELCAAVAANEDSARYYFNQAVQKGYNSPGGQLARKALESLNQPPPNQNNGCFITTAVCDNFGKSDDCYELTTFRKFRDEWLITQSDGKTLIEEYYAVAPRIVANINRLSEAKKIYETIWQKYLVPCLDFINNGDNFSCKQKYIDMVHELKKLYL